MGGGGWSEGRRPRRLFARSLTVRARNGELTRMLLRTVIKCKGKILCSVLAVLV